MKELILTLRQRKLLHYLQQQKDYTTGDALAKHLQVSARTIRSDVNEINRELTGTDITIESKRHWGYLLVSDNKKNLQKLSQASNSFLSRDEQLRHIIFRLCLSDAPIDLYDLEDEMFISRTTLEQDLKHLRKNYVLKHPYIQLKRFKNHISFEPDERKIRLMLNQLFSEIWNYTGRGMIYFQYQYLDERIVNMIIREVNYYMDKHQILIEDINMVILNIQIAIAYYRITSGYDINPPEYNYPIDEESQRAVDELMDHLEDKLSCRFSPEERAEICLHVSCSKVLDNRLLQLSTLEQYISKDIIQFTDQYIRSIYHNYGIDFSDDEDFYITIVQFFRYLAMPLHHFNIPENPVSSMRSQLLNEFEIAYSVQPLAKEFYGIYLEYRELLYLAFCISGALEYKQMTLPRLNTVIMSHLNLPATWNLKRHIESSFGNYLFIAGLLPMHVKDNYNFDEVPIVLSTIDKPIADEDTTKVLYISPFMSNNDLEHIANFIHKNNMMRIYHTGKIDTASLLEKALWHEDLELDDPLDTIRYLADDFVKRGLTDESYTVDILHRESLLSFAFTSPVVILYSSVPCTQTMLSAATFKHRLKWSNNKIRTVIMAALGPEDHNLIFQLINELYYENHTMSEACHLHTKEAFIDYFRKNCL